MLGHKNGLLICVLSLFAANVLGDAGTTSEMSKQYEGLFHELSADTVTNVDGGYIQTKLIVKVGEPEAAKKLKVVEQFEPLILDELIDRLNGSAKSTLKTRSGRKLFRQDASKSVNAALLKEVGTKIVDDVMMTRIYLE